MRFAIAGGLAAVMAVAAAPNARADIGPPDPARRACMGAPDGAACTLDGKSGTCHGPHPSRMYCQTDKPPAQGSGSSAGSSAPIVTDPAPSPAAGSGSAQGSGSAAPLVAGSGAATAPATPPADPPGHKRGCAVADPGSASLIGLAVVALGLRRRRSRAAR